MATTDPTTMTPVEIDTILFANYEQQMRHRDQHRRHGQASPGEAGEASSAGPLNINDSYLRDQVIAAREELAGQHARRTELLDAALPYMAEHHRRGWNRYFLVQNGNGHVHRGMNCHTCFATTTYSWLVNLADCDEDAMIEEWGERACTVCFPAAPTDPNFHRPARVDREAQAARDEEKAVKAAAKAEKAITDVDGTPLRVEGSVIATKVAARNELSREIQNGVFYGPNVGAIEKLSVALQAAGVDWLPVAERAFKKGIKDAVLDPANPYRLTPEQIAETDAKIAANIEATQAVMESLRKYKEVMP